MYYNVIYVGDDFSAFKLSWGDHSETSRECLIPATIYLYAYSLTNKNPLIVYSTSFDSKAINVPARAIKHLLFVRNSSEGIVFNPSKLHFNNVVYIYIYVNNEKRPNTTGMALQFVTTNRPYI